MKLQTERLQLIAGNPELVDTELHDRRRFADLLQARVPVNWPPPLNDNATMKWCLRYFRNHKDSEGWVNWYFVLLDDGQGNAVVIGNGGFRGKPSADGAVEIGYSIVPDHQGRGYASEAVRTLTEWAFSHSEVQRIIAETYPDFKKSIRVLENNGFRFVGAGSGAEVIRFERRRVGAGL